MIQTLDSAKTLICVGSGGVGKTTLAAALGFLAAKRGRRVLVLTIDPSQRLKTILKLSDNGEISQVEHPDLRGKLSAAVIDPKRTFDEFVSRAANQEELFKKILKNRLYQQLSTTLSGSQEFTALEKLYSTHESGNYDLIILDTPPTKHAIDFLNAPQKLSAIFNESVAKWFRQSDQKGSLLSNFVNAGTRQVLRALEALTGSEFMRELSEFFQNIESWRARLEERINSVHRLLVSPDTRFCLVTSFDQAKLKEAAYFGREIRKGGYTLSAVVINRALPTWLLRSSGKDSEVATASSPITKKFDELKKYYQGRDQFYQAFAQDLIAEMKNKDIIFRIPEFERDISNIKDVADLAHLIESRDSLKGAAQ